MSDFTCVYTVDGFVYVAFVIDVFTRRIVGSRVSHAKGVPGKVAARCSGRSVSPTPLRRPGSFPRVGDGTQQGNAATFTVGRVRARREGDVASATRATPPDGEADQLQAVEHAFGEVQLGIREFAGGPVCLFAGSLSKRTGNPRITPKN